MRVIIAFLCVVLVFATARADESYTIKVKVYPASGRTVTFHDVTKSSGSMKIFDEKDKLVVETKPEGNETRLRTTILEVDKDGKATKYLKTYETATETEGGEKKTFSYQGRTVLLERKDEKFRLGVAGDPPLDPADEKKLIDLANSKSESTAILQNLSPGKPVKVGDSWDLPAKPIADAMEEAVIDLKKTKVRCKLAKVYMKEKSLFGSFEINGEFSLTAVDIDGIKITFDSSAYVRAKIMLDVAIDGSSTERIERTENSLKAEGKAKVGDVERRVVFDVSGTDSELTSAEVFDAKARAVPKVIFVASPGEWAVFKPKSGTFLVSMPGRPTESVTKEDAYTLTSWLLETESRSIVYAVSITDMHDPTQISDVKATLKTLVEAAKPTKQKDIEVNGFPGVEFEFNLDNDGITFEVRKQYIIANGRIFEVAAAAVKGKKAEAEKFLKSFQILEKRKAKDD
jgi:hypothetical protein